MKMTAAQKFLTTSVLLIATQGMYGCGMDATRPIIKMPYNPEYCSQHYKNPEKLKDIATGILMFQKFVAQKKKGGEVYVSDIVPALQQSQQGLAKELKALETAIKSQKGKPSAKLNREFSEKTIYYYGGEDLLCGIAELAATTDQNNASGNIVVSRDVVIPAIIERIEYQIEHGRKLLDGDKDQEAIGSLIYPNSNAQAFFRAKQYSNG